MTAKGLLTGLAVLWLGGCASTSTISTRYLSDAAAEPARRVLLVARTPEADIREAWENQCKEQLDSSAVKLVASHTVMPLWYEAGNDHLITWAQQHNIDAILIGELTALLLAPPQVPPEDFTRQERGLDNTGSQTPTWTFWFGDKDPEPVVPPLEHEVEFLFTDVDGTPLWNGIVRTHEANDLEAIAESQCRILGKALRDVQLLR